MSMVRGGLRRPSAAARVRMLGRGMAAIVVASGATAASAACDPNPPQRGGTTICSDRTDGGLIATTDTTVRISAGATLAGGGGAPAFTATSIGNAYGSIVNLAVDGVIDGAGGSAILVASNSSDYGSGVLLNIVVGATGVVQGASGIRLQPDEGGFGRTVASLDNAGSIRADAGAAIVATRPDLSGFFGLNNRAGGFIGGIDVTVSQLTNAGTIDGGGGSAYRFSPTTNGYGNYPGGIDNSGVIRSDGQADTISLPVSFLPIVNTGTIANAGAGAAINASSSLSVYNQAGATISTAGTTALRSGEELTLFNRGEIRGTVTAAAGSRIDTVGGTIRGDVLLGNGNDRVTGVLRGPGGGFADISGRVDGGDGIDVAEYVVTRDVTLDAVAIPQSFEQVQLTTQDGIAVTFAGASTTNVVLAGRGSFTNTGSFITSGATFTSGFNSTYLNQFGFTNRGTITATLVQPGDAAIRLSGLSSFVNEDSITATNGDGVSVSGAIGGVQFVNNGTITATGTGFVGSSGDFLNTGTVRSTGGVGADLSRAGGFFQRSGPYNTGLIEGVTIGVAAGSMLVNTGTIRATDGIGVTLGYGSRIDNLAGGVISGTRGGIDQANNYGSFSLVRNAGTIDGDVRFVPNPNVSSQNESLYIDAGGIINGNLLLGSGLLVTDVARISDGRFLGATGSVDPGADGRLRLRIAADTALRIDDYAGFGGFGLELSDGAAVTLTADRPLTRPLTFAGRGSVDLNADVATVDRSAINLAVLTSDQYLNGVSYPDTAVSVISRGVVSYTRTGGAADLAAVMLAGTSSFENAGTLSTDAAAAIFGGFYASSATVINSGLITLAGGANGITGAGTVVNSGRIVQAPGDTAASSGVLNFETLRNSGTIETTGVAVTVGFGPTSTILNTGRIASANDLAIAMDGFVEGRIENQAGGTIVGGGGIAIRAATATLINAGRIVGDVRFNDFYTSSGSTYIAAGGSIEGNLVFGNRDDRVIVRGGSTGVTGTIDGGQGIDEFIRSYDANATATLGVALPVNFEIEGIEARGPDTTVTVTGSAATLRLLGDGSFINRASLDAGSKADGIALKIGEGAFSFTKSSDIVGTPSAVSNEATIIGGIDGEVGSFVNSAAITLTDRTSILLVGPAKGRPFAFANNGTIGFAAGANDQQIAVDLYNFDFSFDAANGPLPAGISTIVNSGTIAGALYTGATGPIEFSNSGTITAGLNFGSTVYLSTVHLADAPAGSAPIRVVNDGSIVAAATGGVGLAVTSALAGSPPSSEIAAATGELTIVNTGTIAADAAGRLESSFGSFDSYAPSVAVLINNAGERSAASLTNAAGATISAAGAGSSAVVVVGGETFTLDNAGTITGGAGGAVAGVGAVLVGGITYLSGDYLAGAVQVTDAATILRNSGTITGSIALADSDDRVENSGTIDGDVFLGAGDDTFLQGGSARLTGTVDGGIGRDALVVDAADGGFVDGGRFRNFESVAQTGAGNVTYAGMFDVDTIRLDGGAITVAAGSTLRSAGPVAITGGDRGETVSNFGTIDGAVVLGDGGDSYVDGPGSSVGLVDGGSGIDTYVVALSGDRAGFGARTGFEELGVIGAGTLSAALDQDFQAVRLVGTGLDLRLGGFTVGSIGGSDAAESVTVDGDVARIALAGGNDVLRLAVPTLAGSYDGGDGVDTLALLAAGPVTLTGTATGFETIALAGGRLMVAGTLGSDATTIGFGDGAQALTVAAGGRLVGAVDLGTGADSFRLAAGGVLLGSVSGGAGDDIATLDLTADRTIAGNALRDFETLTTTGARTLTFADGAARFDRIDAAGGLVIAAGATLTAPRITFGEGNNRFAVAGGFVGSVDGGAGTDVLDVSGGSAAAPVVFGTIAGFESLAMSAGVATIGNAAQFGRIDMTGGRLIGLAGSTIAAPVIAIGTGATFGSAGTVIGNLAVAGTLSPGASPGTMTVTGNVNLATGSATLLEFTPTISDRLAISGTLSIANGTTLTLAGERPLTPGAALDLIVAAGGITGSFTTVNQATTVLGFLRQSTDRIQLFGQFAASGFDPQVTTTIGYVNSLLTGGGASAGLIAAVPTLLAAGATTNGAAFARLNAEAYASATQIGVQNGLTLAKAGRSGLSTGAEGAAGAFTFVQALGDWRGLDGDTGRGVSRAKMHSYGLLGGIGFGNAEASFGGFAGYLDTQQHIAGLGARTGSDGLIAGVTGHVASAGFDLSALLAYDGGKANTSRLLPGNATAASRYTLRGWVGDARIAYAVPLNAGWALKPEAGLTRIDTKRGGATESGGGAFSLVVASRKSHATFLDGALTLGRGGAGEATIRPWLSAGVRHQLDGRATLANAAFAEAAIGFSVAGVARGATLATAGAGIAVTLTPGLDLFGTYRGEFGQDGTGTNLNGGLRLRF